MDEAKPKPYGRFFAENHVVEPFLRKAEEDVACSFAVADRYSLRTKYLCISCNVETLWVKSNDKINRKLQKNYPLLLRPHDFTSKQFVICVTDFTAKDD